MKLVTFGARGRSMVGVWEGDRVIDLTRAGRWHFEQRGLSRVRARASLPPEMSALLVGGDETLDLAREIADDLRPMLEDPQGARELQEAGIVWHIPEVRLAPPVPSPGPDTVAASKALHPLRIRLRFAANSWSGRVGQSLGSTPTRRSPGPWLTAQDIKPCSERRKPGSLASSFVKTSLGYGATRGRCTRR